MLRSIRLCLGLAFILMLSVPALAFAQSGRISGTVSTVGPTPIPGAQILVSGLGLSARSGETGSFEITGVPAGTYEVKVYRIGYKPVSQSGVSVTSGQVSRIEIAMEAATVQLQGVVVSAARHAEKVTDAAATITVIDAQALENRIGNSYSLALRNAPGLDVTQVGVTSVFVNGRGFNNRFNTRWLTLEDGRVAVLAETSLPIGEHTTIPKLDVAAMEVITGPGSALYGANASNGLLSMRTKDPREYPGFSAEISGGSRNLFDVQTRYAGTTGKWGYKLATEYQSASDWENLIYYPSVTSPTGPTGPLPETIADFHTDVTRVSGSLDYYLANNGRVQFNSGYSRRNGLGDSNSGHYQIDGYEYNQQQLSFSNPRWFAQAYTTHSNSGDTYQIYAAVPDQARNPTISADSIRERTRFHVDGVSYAAELQNNFLVGMLAKTGLAVLDNTLLTWGGQFRRARIHSYQKLYSDVNTKRPIQLDNSGLYAQIETPLTSTLRFAAAARYDAATRYDPQISPRASLMFTPWLDQTFRLTYGEAYRAPPIIPTDAYNFVSATARNIGNTRGFRITDSLGVFLRDISRLVPETNKTWELGYKAVLGARLFVDVTLYQSTFLNFISGGLVVADGPALTKTRAYDPVTGLLHADAAGNPVRVTSYFNLGEGLANGLDASTRFYFTDHLAISSTMSFSKLDTLKVKPTDPKDAGQYNASTNRMSLSLDLTDVPTNLNVSTTVRYSNAYTFRSGVAWGVVPTFGTLDLSASYKIPSRSTTFTIQAQNLASCTGGTFAPPVTGMSASSQGTYTKGRKCGFGLRHLEALSMPALGTMVFVGVRREWK